MPRKLFLPLLAAAAFSYMVWHVAAATTATSQTEPLVEPARSPFNQGVAGAGLIEPRSENIHVAALVPGIVREVVAAEGDQVDPGDVLLRLDDRARKAALAVQEAELAE